MVDMTPVLSLSDGRPVVSSRTLAAHFEKEHCDVLENIRSTIRKLPESFRARNFEAIEYAAQGQLRRYPEYLLTRDGFTLIALGFTGKRALAWKVRYIQAFSAMEEELLRLNSAASAALPLQPVRAEIAGDFTRLKPALRATAMHTAVQAARLTGGTEADIERLFLKYCGWLSPRPAPTVLDEAGRAATGWYAVFLGWTQECLVRSREVKTSAARLYDHFCRHMHEAHPEMLKPSMKEWGREMRARYLREKTSNIYYHVMLPNAEGAVSLSRKWSLYPEAEATEQ